MKRVVLPSNGTEVVKVDEVASAPLKLLVESAFVDYRLDEASTLILGSCFCKCLLDAVMLHQTMNILCNQSG